MIYNRYGDPTEEIQTVRLYVIEFGLQCRLYEWTWKGITLSAHSKRQIVKYRKLNVKNTQ